MLWCLGGSGGGFVRGRVDIFHRAALAKLT